MKHEDTDDIFEIVYSSSPLNSTVQDGLSHGYGRKRTREE